MTRDYCGTSIIRVKNKSDAIKAYLNTCRHRGAPLATEASGKVRNFVCPFHKWAYDLDGRLIHAPGLEDNDRQALPLIGSNLIEIHVAVETSLVFVNLEPSLSYSLAKQLGNFRTAVANPHAIENMRCVERHNDTLDCNWKLYVEVDMETLHIPHVHDKSIGKQAVYPIESKGDWLSYYYQSSRTPALRPGDDRQPLPANPSAYGAGLDGAHYSMLLPGLFLITARDAMWWIQKTPISSGQVNVDVGICFPKSVIGTTEFNEKSPHYLERIRAVIAEDDRITQYQQLGLKNSLASGRLTPKECQVHQIDSWVINKVLSMAA